MPAQLTQESLPALGEGLGRHLWEGSREGVRQRADQLFGSVFGAPGVNAVVPIS